MKKTLLALLLTLLLTSCAAPLPSPTSQTQSTTTLTARPATQTLTPLPASPLPSSTATQNPTPAHQPTRTPQPAAACPQVDPKLRISLGAVFKNKKASSHDARQTVLDFLNAGGDPQLAIQKLAENDLTASQLDISFDGVPEFFLPGGYFTIFGCSQGKYQTLLDLAPSEETASMAIPLLIQDLNLNGVPEIILAQTTLSGARYFFYEWDGEKLETVSPLHFKSENGNIFMTGTEIYTLGQSSEQKGAINGNWETKDIDNDGLKEFIIRAGIYDNFWSGKSSLEETVVLKWNGTHYITKSLSVQATPTQIPTLSPDQFLADCSNTNAALRYTYDENLSLDTLEQSILDFLNRGGKPEQLKSYFPAIIKDLNNDKIPEVLIIQNFGYVSSGVHIYGCVNGQYGSLFSTEITGSTSHDPSILGSAIDPGFEGTIIQDINQNGLPEVFIKSLGCMFSRCGELNIIEWNGTEFAKIFNNPADTTDTHLAGMEYPQKVFLKDLDNDGASEIGWTGAVPDTGDYGFGMPWRLETHTYKWDGSYFTARPIQYGSPEYRFQAVQDGDQFSLNAEYIRALASYQAAIKNNNLGWWTEQRRIYLQASYKTGACVDANPPCQPPTPDTNERPMLSAYSSFRVMLVDLLMNEQTKAETQFQEMQKTYPQDNPGFPYLEMATAFWNEYQSTQNMSDACKKAVSYASAHPDILNVLGSSYHGWQSLSYTPQDVCPFK